MTNKNLSKLLTYAREVENFPLTQCGPSDDPDKQTAFVYGFKECAKKFIGFARLQNYVEIQDVLKNINCDIESIYEAYDLRTDLLPIIDWFDGFVQEKETASETDFSSTEFWLILHPEIRQISKSRFDSGHFADAVEAALKAVNTKVKSIYLMAKGEELDGYKLMTAAFSENNPVIVLDDLTTESGKNIQGGYMHLFAGAIKGIRNPKAHSNITITKDRAIHLLVLASLLMKRIDERVSP